MPKLIPCKHLDYDESKYGDTCEIETHPCYPNPHYRILRETRTFDVVDSSKRDES